MFDSSRRCEEAEKAGDSSSLDKVVNRLERKEFRRLALEVLWSVKDWNQSNLTVLGMNLSVLIRKMLPCPFNNEYTYTLAGAQR